MREFILLALKGKTSPDFNTSKLPQAGRLDLVCRTISNALFISNAVRRDTIIHIALSGPKSPPKTITFNGENIKNLEPDEISIAKKIKEALEKGLNLKLNETINVSDGITVSKKAFETLIKEKSPLYYLHPKGANIRNTKIKNNPIFILGDFIGLPRKTEKFLERFNTQKISLGPTKLFASHCIIIVHNELDQT